MAHRKRSVAALAKLLAVVTLSVEDCSASDSADYVSILVEENYDVPSIGNINHDNYNASVGIQALIQYIHKHESEGAVKAQGVRSSYDVVYDGIGTQDRPPIPLTMMTVAEVLAWQDSIDTHYRSEAAGAYQVLEDTLRNLVDSGLVDSNAVFNEATQDAVAKHLLERRGLFKFIAGEISEEDFADNLAREWSSFPVVRDQKGASRFVRRGQSYYSGDNMNKAHADPDEFLSVIKGIGVLG